MLSLGIFHLFITKLIYSPMFKCSSSLVQLVYLELLRYSTFSSSDIRGNSSVWSIKVNNHKGGHEKKEDVNDVKEEVSFYKIKSIFFPSFLSLSVWFSHLRVSSKEDPISGCWDLQLLIFWGCFSLKVVFISVPLE